MAPRIKMITNVVTVAFSNGISVFRNSSVVVKSLCCFILLGYVLSYFEGIVDFLIFTPGQFLPPHFMIWTVLSHCFIELNLWQLIIDIVALFYMARLIEPLWGAMEMVTFFVIVNVSTTLILLFMCFIAYMFTSNPELLFDVRIHGLTAYVAAVTVAVKQVMPDQVLIRTPIGRLSNRNVPLCILLMFLILWMMGCFEVIYCVMFAFGILNGWVYLRFYQKHSNGTRGDLSYQLETSSDFSFANFFPNVMQRPIVAFSNLVYKIFRKCHVFPSKETRYTGTGLLNNEVSIKMLSGEAVESERRRQIALKALSERLGQMPQVSAWPKSDEIASDSVAVEIQTSDQATEENNVPATVNPDEEQETKTVINI